MSQYPVLNNFNKNTFYIWDSTSGVMRPVTSADFAGASVTTNTKLKDDSDNNINNFNALPVQLKGPSSTAFGEVKSSSPRPQVQAYLNSLNDLRIWNQFTGQGDGRFFQGSGYGVLNIGPTFLAYSTLQTKQSVSYLPGEGVTSRFTAEFNNGVANSLQLVGPYHGEDGFGFGYNGTNFGIFHRHDRKLHISKLTITGAASTATTATITLNGTPNTINIGAQGDVKSDARQIATGANYTENGFLTLDHRAFAIEDSVYFTRSTHGPITGEFSYSLAAGNGGGDFATFSSGENGSTDWYYQTGWNIDKMDGSGISSNTLNPQAINIYQITYGWLGAMPPIFYVAPSGDQQLSPVHLIDWTNTKSGVHIQDPRTPITYAVASAGSTTQMSLKGGSCYAAVDGEDSKLGPKWAVDNEKTADTTETSILAVENSRVDLSKNSFNRRRLIVQDIELSNESATKSATIRLYKGDKTSLNGYVFNSDDNNSNLLYDVSGSSINLNGSTEKIKTIPLGPSQSTAIKLSEILQPTEVLIATTQTSSSTAPIICSFNGEEDL